MDNRFVVQNKAGNYFTEVTDFRTEDVIVTNQSGKFVDQRQIPTAFEFGTTNVDLATKFDTLKDAQAFIDDHGLTDCKPTPAASSAELKALFDAYGVK